MADLFADLRDRCLDEHPVAEAAVFHARLEAIHPFVDGSGRAGRLAANLLLLRAGYPFANIQPEERARYFEALEACRLGDPGPITVVFAEASERTGDVILRAGDGGAPRTGP